MVEACMCRFQWKRVWNAMVSLGWCWHVPGSEPCVPTEKELRLEARRLFGMLAEMQGNVSIESGGLVARRSDGVLSLSMELEAVSAVEE
jgi:hypothetical protein